ncbi:hypothetical protein QYF61_026402 [Mycteria americana]|uniref:glucuronosyltransferase n=1 Tax=Mycteria americana TaxID=33587 RepID=A0AAN7RUN2_MYCAM|nr:hypothetical protein QYF61_026402 [Mycteria americana]
MEELMRSLSANCFSEEPFLPRFLNTWGNFRKSSAMFQACCSSLLYNKEMKKYIEESKFDAIFTDPLTPCGQIIALRFSNPTVFFLWGIPLLSHKWSSLPSMQHPKCTQSQGIDLFLVLRKTRCWVLQYYFNILHMPKDIHAAQSPDPPPYIPRMFSFNTDRMMLPQRVKNFLISLSESFTCSMVFSPFESLASDFLQKPMTITQFCHGSIWLKRLDFLFHYPMPVMPNMIFPGAINCRQTKPLSQVQGQLSGFSFLLLLEEENDQERHREIGVLVFLSLFCLADGGKLLVVPMDGSHWLSMRSVLVALSQKEHEIVVVAPEVNLNVKASEYYTLKTYPVSLTREELGASMHSFANDLFERRPFFQRITALYEKVQVISSLYVSSCTSLLHNKDLMQCLEGSKFDAVLTDPVVPCGQILALHLSIPSVFFLRGLPCSFDLQATQCPDPPSYVPRTFTDNSDHMTFIQRVENLLFKSSESFLCNFAYLPFELLASDVLRKPVTMKELLSHGSIWLKRMDFVFEYPMPVMPNVVFIGGINCGKKKPLSQISAEMALVLSAHLQGTAALALLLSVLSLAAGGKLLVVPVDGSCWLSMWEVLDGLRQRGHEIVVVAPEINIHIKPSENFVMKMYPIPFTKEEVGRSIHSFSREVFEEGSFLERFLKVYQSMKSISAITLSACAHLLYNKELVRYLEESKFDVVLTDPVLPWQTTVASCFHLHQSCQSRNHLKQLFHICCGAISLLEMGLQGETEGMGRAQGEGAASARPSRDVDGTHLLHCKRFSQREATRSAVPPRTTPASSLGHPLLFLY